MRGTVIGFGIALAGIAGCANAHEANGETDAGRIAPVADASPIVLPDVGLIPDAAPIAIMCGDEVCAPGFVCCNASCGICTPPGVDCIDIACADAGAPRVCGGLASRPCDPSEYCDYPDGSACGATDAQGVCRPRPPDCTPGDTPVCGCDGMDYGSECAANVSGVDVARFGHCGMPTPARPRSISATRGCAPFDGPAWDFNITSSDTAVCDASLPALRISIWNDLSTVTPDQLFRIEQTESEGSALSCLAGVGGPPCMSFFGTVTVHSFSASTGAVISYDLTASPGSGHVSGDHLSVSLWCPMAPLCG